MMLFKILLINNINLIMIKVNFLNTKSQKL